MSERTKLRNGLKPTDVDMSSRGDLEATLEALTKRDEELALLMRKDELLCQQNGNLLIEQHDLNAELARLRGALEEIATSTYQSAELARITARTRLDESTDGSGEAGDDVDYRDLDAPIVFSGQCDHGVPIGQTCKPCNRIYGTGEPEFGKEVKGDE